MLHNEKTLYTNMKGLTYMHTIINSLTQLDSIKVDSPIYIYGAKTIAIRVCMYLENIQNRGGGGEVKGFLVSNKYENPHELCHKPVYRIEEMGSENLGTVILAAGWQFVEEITKDLSHYNISQLNIISPLLYDSWPMDIIKTPGCKISTHAAISDSAQIFADDTSEIIIESGVIIHDKVCILASRNSKVFIKENTQIKEKAFFYVEDGSLTIGANSHLAERASLTVKENSIILLDRKSSMDEKATLSAQGNSHIRLGTHTHLAEKATLRADKQSSIHANRNLSLGEGSTIYTTIKSMTKLDHHITISKDATIFTEKKGTLHISHNAHIGNISFICSKNYGKLKIGCNVKLGLYGHLASYNSEILIGDKTTICPNFYICADHSKIDIGEDNMFSLFVKMNTGSHEIVDAATGNIIDNTAPIITGNHVWLGMGSTLLPGANIGEGSIVGAATLVNKTIPANSICAGVPAKVIRENIKWNREKSK